MIKARFLEGLTGEELPLKVNGRLTGVSAEKAWKMESLATTGLAALYK
jgi:hypothetical protein